MNDFEIKSICFYLKELNIVSSLISQSKHRDNCYDCYFEFSYQDNTFVDFIQLEVYSFNGEKIELNEHISKIKRSITNLQNNISHCYYSNNKINKSGLSSQCIVSILSQIDFRHSLFEFKFNLKLEESSLRQKILYLNSHGFNNLFILKKLTTDFDLD